MKLYKWVRYELGSDRYMIEYHRKITGTFVIYCKEHPESKFVDDPEKTHMYTNEGGLICVARGREPRDFETAEAIAHLWMRGYSEYTQTGIFPATGGRVAT